MIFACGSDIGKVRNENQDSCDAFEYKDAVFLIVADGMGGHKGGQTASALAVKCVREMIEQEYEKNISESVLISLLNSCYVSANMEILQRSLKDEELSGMGTTLVVAALRADGAVVLNVGDSRAYIATDTDIKVLTKDQSYVQYLVDKGEISEQEAVNHPQKNIIMQAVGVSTEVVPDVYTTECGGKMVLLCSDGLSNKLSGGDMMKILCEKIPIHAKVDKMIQEANDAGGEDNITAALAYDE